MSRFRALATVAIGCASLAVFVGGSNSLGAAEPTPTCNGLDATIVVSEATTQAIEGTEGDDVMVVHGAELNQWVLGLGGDDAICTYNVPNIAGGDGDDYLHVVEPIDETQITHILGGEGNDVIVGADDSFLEGISRGPGDDVLDGAGGWDIISGDDGDDTIFGRAGDDYLIGGGGSDVIRGGWGIDTIFGGHDVQGHAPEDPADDTGDVLYGGPGDDWLIGQLGADEIRGGDGDDVLISNAPESIEAINSSTRLAFVDTAGARMFGGSGDDLLVGSNRWDRMQGGPGNDMLWGFEGRDFIRGGSGADTLVGGSGIDDTHGNGGDDLIIRHGADTTNGGYGLDRCQWAGWPERRKTASCEETGAPALEYEPPVWYSSIRESFERHLEDSPD